jgi:hypothetical protein
MLVPCFLNLNILCPSEAIQILLILILLYYGLREMILGL